MAENKRNKKKKLRTQIYIYILQYNYGAINKIDYYQF